MLQVNIGRYGYKKSFGNYYMLYRHLTPTEQSDIDNRVKNYDNILYKSLDEIYSKRCLSSSGQIKKFRQDPQCNNDWKSTIIKPILEQEPILSERFTKEELDKLSLLWIAVLGCYQQSAELLVRSGADVNELFGRHGSGVIDEKWTVLHVLLQMRSSPENERLIRLVADHGADLQARDSSGRTVLHHAIMKGRVQMTEMLLDKGADVNAANDYGETPLHVATHCSNKAKELVPLLVEHGADIFVKNSDGENVLHHLIYCLPVRDAVDLTRFFIDKGVSFDEKDHGGHNHPIHLAAEAGKNELVKLYLDHGVNVNILTGQGESPLYKAAGIGKTIVVETLIKRGANIHLRTKISRRTALHAVCLYSSLSSRFDKCCEIIIRLLLFAGADMLDEDCDGKTPLALISSRRNGEQPGQESCLRLIEALALKKALEPWIELKDEKIIERYKNLQEYYQRCTVEIGRMKSTRFIDSCTFFELFTKGRCQIAALMRNPEFESKFSIYDLNDKLPIYAEDVRRAFERSLKHHHSLLEQENVINEAVYNILPDLVVKKVVHYIINCCKNV